MKSLTLKNHSWIFFSIIYLSLVIGLFGSIMGTYAWYQYNSRASAGYKGTAVGFEGGLSCGLVCDHKINDLENEFDLVLDDESLPGEYIYWSSTGITSDMMECFSSSREYAFNEIGPTTTGEYKTGESINMYSSPIHLNSKIHSNAIKSDYAYMRLAFKEGTYPGIRSSLFIQSCSLECQEEIRHSVRLGFYSKYDANGFIFNPDTIEDGYDEVAGLLDLNKDGYYDYFGDQEFIYGEYEDAKYSSAYTEDVINFEEKQLNTFDANHMAGNKTPTFTAKRAEYLGKNTVINNKKTILQPTFEETTAVVDLYIYLEGWNRSCVESELFHGFSLYLTFGC